MPQTRKDWHQEDIKAAIRKTGITLNNLSIRSGLAESAARMTLHKPWPRMQAIIAKQIGVAPETIWPSRYDEAGRPLKGLRSTEAENRRKAENAHSQKMRAA